MCTSTRQSALYWIIALALFFVVQTSQAQVTTVFTTNGFESPFTPGSILLQQGFVNAPLDLDSGQIQTTTVRTGSQAFQAVGANFAVQGFSGTGANFWYRDGFSYNPTLSGTPYVQAHFSGLMAPGGIDTIPAAGIYLEGKTAGGTTQGLVTVMFSSQGQLIASTNAATGGASQAITTANGQFDSSQWHDLYAEMNFTSQTYRVYREGETTPIQFQKSTGEFISDIPFRNTFGTTATIYEIGMLAYNFTVSAGAETAPSGSFYLDNYSVTASPNAFSPVPEPGLIITTAAIGCGVIRLIRRRRQTAT
jgi:hypothetical protein